MSSSSCHEIKHETKAAIVCTLRMPSHASTVTRSFVEYHTRIGFSHIFLFFDVESPSSAYKEVCEERNVTVFLRDDALKSKLQKLSVWKDWGKYYEDEVQARQSLNATLALELCREKGMKWLLHIDSDELFHVSNSNTIHAHFAQLEKDNVMSLTYTNHEGVRVLFDTSLSLLIHHKIVSNHRYRKISTSTQIHNKITFVRLLCFEDIS